jgi:hypothetical protein
MYRISVVQAADDRARVTVDGIEQQDAAVPLVDDRAEHAVEVSIRLARA